MITRLVTRDLETGVWTVSFQGELNLDDHAFVRRTLEKCLAECPAAIIADLHGVISHDDLLLGTLPAIQRRTVEAGVKLLFTAAEALLARIRRITEAYSTLREAMAAALRPGGFRWLRITLMPGPRSGSQARSLIGEACAAWGVPHVTHHATLLVTELVDNAVKHAGTLVEVIATVRGEHLLIRVRDGSRAHPAVDELQGLGLRLVDRYASDWGVTDTEDGKAVWATVQIRPLSAGANGATRPRIQPWPGENAPWEHARWATGRRRSVAPS